MANFTNFAEEKALEFLFRGESEIYVSLVDDTAEVADLEEGDLEKIPEIDVERQIIEFTKPIQDKGKGIIKNVADIEFEKMPEVTVKYIIIVNDETEVLAWSKLEDERSVNVGDIFRLPEGDQVIKID